MFIDQYLSRMDSNKIWDAIDKTERETPGTATTKRRRRRDVANQDSTPSENPNDVRDPANTSKTTILDASHVAACDHPEHDTVLVLPDYKVVVEVERSLEGAQQLWRAAVDPAVGRAGAVNPSEGDVSPLRSYVLPYAVVILLCAWAPSHRVLLRAEAAVILTRFA